MTASTRAPGAHPTGESSRSSRLRSCSPPRWPVLRSLTTRLRAGPPPMLGPAAIRRCQPHVTAASCTQRQPRRVARHYGRQLRRAVRPHYPHCHRRHARAHDQLRAKHGLRHRDKATGERGATTGGSPLQAPVAWGCDFTRYYDQTTAASWRQYSGKSRPGTPRCGCAQPRVRCTDSNRRELDESHVRADLSVGSGVFGSLRSPWAHRQTAREP